MLRRIETAIQEDDAVERKGRSWLAGEEVLPQRDRVVVDDEHRPLDARGVDDLRQHLVLQRVAPGPPGL
jgi:hypothetical protein